MATFTDEATIQGWCPVPLMEILNNAVSKMKAGEVYLEIGTFCGRSLAAALKDNDAKAIVIDPLNLWTQNGTIQDIWNKTVGDFNLRDRITLYKQHSESFCGELPPIGVFFYDGNHDSGHTFENLLKFFPYLAKDAVIIVDDYNIYGGDQQNVFHGHELDIISPVKTDVDRWCKINNKIPTITPWLNGQAIIQL